MAVQCSALCTQSCSAVISCLEQWSAVQCSDQLYSAVISCIAPTTTTRWKSHCMCCNFTKEEGRGKSLRILKLVFNRPGVAGAVLQTPLSLIESVSQFVSQWAFSSKSSKYCKSQSGRARELPFWENVYPPQHVTCHMSCVTCHMSHVTCNKSHFMCHVSHVTCNKSHFMFHVSHVTFFLLLFFS